MTDMALAVAHEFEMAGLSIQITAYPDHIAVMGYPRGAITTANDPVAAFNALLFTLPPEIELRRR
jgi:hypothetical protein